MPKIRMADYQLDKSIEKRHELESKVYDDKIAAILAEPELKNTTWQSLFTHPKLMSQFYWKDRKIHDKQQRIEEIKAAIGIKDAKVKRDVKLHPWINNPYQSESRLLTELEKAGKNRVLDKVHPLVSNLNGQSGLWKSDAKLGGQQPQNAPP